jgi:hypothetical protein
VLLFVIFVFGDPSDFRTPNLGAHHGFSPKIAHDATAEEVRENTPTETDQEEHYNFEDI